MSTVEQTNAVTDSEWLASIVAQVTRRPCVVEFVPEDRSTDIFFGTRRTAEHWKITIKGVQYTPHIEPARVKLRDDEFVRSRVIGCLPESERTAS